MVMEDKAMGYSLGEYSDGCTDGQSSILRSSITIRGASLNRPWIRRGNGVGEEWFCFA